MNNQIKKDLIYLKLNIFYIISNNDTDNDIEFIENFINKYSRNKIKFNKNSFLTKIKNNPINYYNNLLLKIINVEIDLLEKKDFKENFSNLLNYLGE